jgi:undecaprenyl diphosphate synthase
MSPNQAQDGRARTVQKEKTRIPEHIGFIPDGNRRWALGQGMEKKDGYAFGVDPGLQLYERCRQIGVKEVSVYGFTQENTHRPREQREAYQQACIEGVKRLSDQDAELLVVGDLTSDMFPPELRQYTVRTRLGRGGIKVNFLINYSWRWDIEQLRRSGRIGSHDVSNIDLVIRWGGRNRLSGFLPVQSAYADIFVLEELWPDYREEHLDRALSWYKRQDVTRGG